MFVTNANQVMIYRAVRHPILLRMCVILMFKTARKAALKVKTHAINATVIFMVLSAILSTVATLQIVRQQ